MTPRFYKEERVIYAIYGRYKQGARYENSPVGEWHELGTYSERDTATDNRDYYNSRDSDREYVAVKMATTFTEIA